MSNRPGVDHRRRDATARGGTRGLGQRHGAHLRCGAEVCGIALDGGGSPPCNLRAASASRSMPWSAMPTTTRSRAVCSVATLRAPFPRPASRNARCRRSRGTFMRGRPDFPWRTTPCSSATTIAASSTPFSGAAKCRRVPPCMFAHRTGTMRLVRRKIGRSGCFSSSTLRRTAMSTNLTQRRSGHAGSGRSTDWRPLGSRWT